MPGQAGLRYDRLGTRNPSATRLWVPVNNTALAIIIMLISSAMYALSFVLQHKGTQQAIGLSGGQAEPGASTASVATLLRNPTWVVGVILFGLSFLVHLVALGFGAVAIVQPLIVTELVFIPPLAAIISHAVITRKDWAAILSVCAGLAAFILVAQPSEGDRTPDATQWLITLAVTIVLVAALMTVGRRQRDSVRATLFGVAAGLVNALLAILAKGAFAADHPGISDWLTDPLVWLTVVAALASVWSATLAFRAGPITSSTPAMISINPIVSTLAAMWLFGEALRITPMSVVLIVIAIVVVIGGVYVLSNSDAVHGAEAEEPASAVGS